MRYFFHVTHDDPRVDDENGVDLADGKAAWEQATRACGEMIRDIDGNLSQGTDWCMDVEDETGPVFSIHFGASKAPGAEETAKNASVHIDDVVAGIRALRGMIFRSGLHGELTDVEALLSVALGEVENVRGSLRSRKGTTGSN